MTTPHEPNPDHAYCDQGCDAPDCAHTPMLVEVPDPMPVFPLRAKDRLALATIEFYRAECEAHGLTEQAREVDAAIDEWVAWQARNLDQMKMPDHKHVLARPA